MSIGKFILYHHTKYNMSSSSSSLDTDIKLKAKKFVCIVTTLSFYTIQVNVTSKYNADVSYIYHFMEAWIPQLVYKLNMG